MGEINWGEILPRRTILEELSLKRNGDLSNELGEKELVELIKDIKYSVEKNVGSDAIVNGIFVEEEHIEVVIVCALQEERDQVLKILGTGTVTSYRDMQKEYGFVYQKVSIQDIKIAVVTQTGMGMAMSSSLTTRAILAFNPKLVIMIGICAGRRDKVNLGDILFADQVYDYTAGKISKGEKFVRPRSISLDDEIKQILLSPEMNIQDINGLIRAKWMENSIPVSKSEVYIKAMGTGTSVIDDENIIEDAKKNQDELYGIDMEAYGVALASDVLHTPWLIVKGVQDFADGNKNTMEVNVREYAAFVSVVVLEKIIPIYLR